jgi:hypothetical protein
MRIGRRPVFFAVVAIVCLALMPVTPSEFRWLNEAMAALAVFWAVMLGLEDLAHTRRDERGGAAP